MERLRILHSELIFFLLADINKNTGDINKKKIFYLTNAIGNSLCHEIVIERPSFFIQAF